MSRAKEVMKEAQIKMVKGLETAGIEGVLRTSKGLCGPQIV